MSKRTCSLDGCEKPVKGRGWCNTHYVQWWSRGGKQPEVIERDPAVRMMPLILIAPDGCWLWTGCINPRSGYGHYTVQGKTWKAHRFVYTALVGPIPDGLTLDHLCRVRACVNPDHLEPVTPRENTLRSPIAPAAINARQTHCRRGHPYAGTNLVPAGKGGLSRGCRTCRNEQERIRRARLRDADSILTVTTEGVSGD